MLDLVYRYENGFVAVPVLLSCRRGGVFDRLRRPGGMTIEELAAECGANTGHLNVAIDMLRTLGFVRDVAGGRLTLTREGESQAEIPDAMLELYEHEGDAFLPALTSGTLRPWLERCRSRWPGVSAGVRDLLDGAVLVPLFVALFRHDLLDRLESGARPSVGAGQTAVAAVRGLFADLGFGRFDEGRFHLSPAGAFLVERALFHGVPVSYQPMLRRMDALLFGDARAVFGHGPDGHERHVDRGLNVIASGDQHRTYFAEMQELVVAYLDGLPLDAQPRYVVDMGCGDGTLLRLLYTAVATRARRGRVLDAHPLVMVGVDFNAASLEEAGRTLAGIPHMLLTGDIADPTRMMADLAARGVSEADGILHVRSFLDHDRAVRAPDDAAAADALARLPLAGRYVDRAGRAIRPADAVRSLVEHFERWREVVSRHGLCLVEVHRLDVETTRRYLELTNSFHFQALQAFSGQQLVAADVFLMAAAQAGLFADFRLSRRYPRAFPFTHISLNWLRPAPYRIRYADPSDVPALVALEAACWTEPLRAPESEIRRRLDAFPAGCLVLEHEGRLAGAIYSQRIARVADLERARMGDVARLGRPDGAVLQILGLNVRPDVQHPGLGDQLLAFFLHLASRRSGIERACGITRCRDFAVHPELTLEQYTRLEDPDGRPADPILNFHVSHGARIRAVVPDYRPEDRDNNGAGVLVEYEQLPGGATPEAQPAPADDTMASVPTTPGEIAACVDSCVRRILGRDVTDDAMDTPLMELGLDSLQLLELRTLLATRLGVAIEPTVFFDYPTPRALGAWLTDRRAHGANSGVTASRHEHVRDHAAVAPALPISWPVAGVRPGEDEAGADRIAIVGMACRFPGGAESPAAYWRLLTSGTDAVTEMPAERYPLLGLTARDPAARRRAGYLSGVDRFDAAFFRIPSAEADALDPQHRLLLELAWESLEDAGIDATRLEGSSTGLFVGLFSHDYELLQVRRPDAGALGAWLATGNAAAMGAGRLAYFLGLRGPALTLDTACSSSLVAVHLACSSLRSGESELAVALGANLILSPELTASFEKAGMLAPDGRCKTFSADADGYVRSEGGAAVVLKRLDRALADGDRIWGVIRGSAVNQDGASNGLTAPNGRAQRDVLRTALAAAGTTPTHVSYIELHGTGTPLGDPVEFEAIRDVYGPTRRDAPPLLLGSVKTVIGHTEAAAGLAGLVKTVLALHHRTIPPHLHLRTLNPHIDLATLPASIPTSPLAWPSGSGTPRMAGVSSFGFSGTNAHVIVEEAPAIPSASGEPARTHHILPLSGHTDGALKHSALRLSAWLDEHPECDPGDVAYTLAVGRARFEHRAAWVFDTTEELRAGLAAFASGDEAAPFAGRGTVRPRIAFLFTGQGSQYLAMAHGLYRSQPLFRRTLDRCAEALRDLLPRPLLEVMFEDAAAIDQTGFAQPALFSVEMALAELLRSWGLAPDLVLGHSVGEYAAACTAGVFSLDDGLRLIAGRGRLMQALPAGGAMAAVFCRAEQVLPHLAGIPGVGLAGDNGVQAVISGPAAGVDAALAGLAAADIRGVRLTVSHAFHSALLDPMLDDLERLAGQIEHRPPQLPLISNLTGAPVDAATPLGATYWSRHSREPVRFGPSIGALAKQGCNLLVEIGPTPVLTPLALRAWPSDVPPPRTAAVLRRGVNDDRQIAEALAACYAAGAPVDWRAWDGAWTRRRVSLPTYPFQRRSHWLGAPRAAADADAGAAPAAGSRRGIVADLDRAQPSERPALLADYVRRTVVSSLKQVPDPLDPKAGFFDLGMDSLVAVTLYNRLDTDLREVCDIEPTVVFDHPTLENLTGYLTALYLGAVGERPAAIPPRPARAEPASLSEATEAGADAIAVVGLSCRFPGADDPEAFWELLMSGRDPIRRVPAERWDADAWYDPDPDAPGRMWTREGGFLDDIAGFDAQFFGIAPREVPSMDPQHRLLLEVSWEALERAGIVPASLADSRTGVFVGICGNEYAQVAQSAGPESIDAYFGVGYAMSAAAGRLAYTLGLRGPALSIDTACSSSLVAVHQACRALQEGACELALAAGVNLILNPLLNVSLTKARMLAPDGRCKTFSAEADGYVRSDGCGVLVLRRLADAQRAGDHILAVIRGSAVNQDGRSGGLTVPNGPAQEAVIRAALDQARVHPGEIGFVEAHGTGTSLGDPIEIQALANVLGEGRAESEPVRLGAVKSNIGHLEAAAGVAGLIKVVLALGRGRLPGQLHYGEPNPVVPWQRLPVRVVRDAVEWSEPGRLAGVSSFGFTGTNAHVVVAPAPVPVDHAPVAPTAAPQLLCLSARTKPALRALVSRYVDWLERNADVDFADLCYTAAARRSHWEERIAVVASSVAEARETLAEWYAGAHPAGAQAGKVERDARPIGEDRLAALPIAERAAAYVRGGDAVACARADRGRPVPLPTYAFQHQRYWVEGAAFPPSPAATAPSAPEAPLLLPTGQLIVRTVLNPRRQPWLAQHRVDGRILVPGAWVATTALSALGAPGTLRRLVLREPLVLDAGGARGTQLVLAKAGADGSRDFELYAEEARGGGAWTLAATGTVGAAVRSPIAEERPFVPGDLTAAVADAFYAACSARGLAYGPAFRAIRALAAGAASATAELTFGDARDDMPASAGRPAYLDACLQVAAAAGRPTPRPLLPFAIDEMEIPSRFPSRLYCRAVIRPSGGDRSVIADLTLYDLQGRRIGHVTGLVCRQLESQPEPDDRTVTDWLYRTVWEESPALAAPDVLRRSVANEPATNGAEPEMLVRRLESLATIHVPRAFAELGWPLQAGARFAEAALADALRVRQKHRRLWRRLLVILADAGVIAPRDDDWVVLRDVAPDTPPAVESTDPAELVLLDRCGRALAEVLRGEVDPLALLFPRDGSAGAEDVYRDSRTVGAVHRAAADIVGTAVAGLPRSRPVRILEIGAGTGGATRAILPRLGARAVHYAYTDVSASFFDAAERRFAEFPFVDYRVLDIERDPEAQGFAPGEWDIVVAANVLHATRDLPKALAHARRLLAPAGLLLVQEAVVPRAWLDLTFGLLPGWWHFGDSARHDYPLLSGVEWRTVLEGAGFTEATDLHPPGAGSDQAVMIARAPSVPHRVRGPHAWLVLADAGGVGAELVERLEARGDRCLVLKARDFTETAGPDAPSALEHAVADACKAGVDGAVFLWALDAPPEVDGSEPVDAVRGALSGALRLVRALALAGTALDAGLWMVTRGAQPVTDDEAPALLQSPVWGLAKVIGIEHPELRCRRIDLAPENDAASAGLLAAELTGGAADDEIALRGTRRLVSRLESLPPFVRNGRPGIHAGVTYLVTGGLGGLGLETARWLVRSGARHIALCGRHAPDDASRSVLDELRSAGADVRVFTADVTSSSDVRRMFDEMAADMPSLGGVFHAAGVLDDGALINQNWQRFVPVLGPKLDGAWTLHRLTRDMPLDLFVLYSSTASLLGSPGQANHAAANSFLDALAHVRRRQGLPATSINWSGWSRVGAAAREDVAQRLAAQGIDMISPSQGVAALEVILAGNPPQAAVLPSRRTDAPAADSTTALRRHARTERETVAEDGADDSDLRRRLDGATRDERRRLISGELRRIVARALRLDPPDQLDPRAGFFDLGMDSLMSLEIRGRVEERLALVRPLAVSAMFDHPTIEQLADFLLHTGWPENGSNGASANGKTVQDPLAQEIAGMSDAELEAIIADEWRALSRDQGDDRNGMGGEETK